MARNDYETAIKALGMTIATTETHGAFTVIGACIETKRGMLEAYVGSNGTAKIVKPNGSCKYLYEKSAAQLLAILRQTISFNN